MDHAAMSASKPEDGQQVAQDLIEDFGRQIAAGATERAQMAALLKQKDRQIANLTQLVNVLQGQIKDQKPVAANDAPPLQSAAE